MSENKEPTLEELMDEITEVKSLIMQEGALMMKKLQAIQDAQPPRIVINQHVSEEVLREQMFQSLKSAKRRGKP